ncbi:MAG TPA: class I SAM-dependent methyltransferase [Puia sp.]|nr:class I SAM-dependent methyltransferase [Puia sp.]
MKDNFSILADQYAQFRPTYPAALFDHLFGLTPAKDAAWDCGTGNGQIAQRLASVFPNVQATDISRQQLDNAVTLPSIHYSLQPAEKTDFPDHCFDLITVAQAIHWFDFDAFYAEVNRTIRPGGILAVIGYHLPRFNAAVDAVIADFYRTIVGPYWDKERRYIDDNYTTIPFPYADLPAPAFTIDVQWSFDHLIGYLETWSAVKHYQKEKGENPVRLVEARLKTAWGEAGGLSGHFPILLRLARVQ